MRLPVLLGALLALSACESDPLPRGIMALDGRPAPPLALADLDARPYDLTADRGRWVLVHFWASWCGPCRREMPTIQALHDRLGDELPIVLVNTAETDEEVFAFLGSVAPNLDTLMDRDGAATAAWQPRGLPASFLVDPQGRLRYLALGGRDWVRPDLIGFLRGLVRPPEP